MARKFKNCNLTFFTGFDATQGFGTRTEIQSEFGLWRPGHYSLFGYYRLSNCEEGWSCFETYECFYALEQKSSQRIDFSRVSYY